MIEFSGTIFDDEASIQDVVTALGKKDGFVAYAHSIRRVPYIETTHSAQDILDNC